MKISLGSDHRGFHSKEHIKSLLAELGHKAIDFGADSDASSDYPDYAIPVCLSVARGETERGILLCGTGIGTTIVANKVAGIRAALCHDELTADMSRRHNDANILCLPADLIGAELVRRMIEVWLNTPFEGGRHARRIKKVMEAERFLSKEAVKAATLPPPKKPRKTKQ